MKEIVILVIVLVSCYCYKPESRSSFYFIDENGKTWLEDLTKEPSHLTVSPEDVKIYYFAQENPSNAYQLPCNDASNIVNTPFNPEKPTIFAIHGWRNSYTSESCTNIKEAFLPKFDVNVFLVDWSVIAQEDYSTCVETLNAVGKYISGFVKLLGEKHGLKFSNVKIVGHSLGAHVAGIIGKELNGEVGEITGLDPAGPSFSKDDISKRLDSTDAQFVEVIHTNAGNLGVDYSIGHVDYWPNGGKSQPGCAPDYYGMCSHGRSFFYFAESINTKKFLSKQCGSYLFFKAGLCNTHASSSMGMLNEDTNARGQYYLDTNSESPFARG